MQQDTGTSPAETTGQSITLSTQSVFAGRIEPAYRSELDRLISSNAIQRLWAKDPSLWPSAKRKQRNLAANLAWLDLPQQMGRYMAQVGDLVAQTQRAGFQDVVFIAMGNSNLAMEAASRASDQIRWRRIFLLNSTDPATIDKQLDFRSTLFVFASKSGKRIETHSLLLYFLERLKGEGTTEPGRTWTTWRDSSSNP